MAQKWRINIKNSLFTASQYDCSADCSLTDYKRTFCFPETDPSLSFNCYLCSLILGLAADQEELWELTQRQTLQVETLVGRRQDTLRSELRYFI
jgi:hypothetical protein